MKPLEAMQQGKEKHLNFLIKKIIIIKKKKKKPVQATQQGLGLRYVHR